MGGKTVIALGLVAGLVAGGMIVAGVIALAPAVPPVSPLITPSPPASAAPLTSGAPTGDAVRVANPGASGVDASNRHLIGAARDRDFVRAEPV